MPSRDRLWIVEPPRRDATALAAALGITPLVARILAARGLDAPDAARAFLDPSLGDLSDPFAYAGMATAARRLAEAVRRGEAIAVYGDYDVDGVGASAIAIRALRRLGADPRWRLPTRAEGYGLHAAAVRDLAAAGARVLVALDCGVGAVEEARLARDLGVDLIVIDHHEPPAALPEALAVVDPKRPDCPSDFKSPCAAGLTWQLVRGVCRLLGAPEPGDLLDLAALGTIADMVPLVGDNRVLARHGLAAMREPRPALAALAAVAGLAGAIDEEAVGWQIGPRLNAAGRLGDPAPALRLLLADDPAEAAALAADLDAANRERQAIHDRILGEALAGAEAMAASPAIVVAGEGWHHGVIGVVASKVAEQFYRPAILLAVDEGVARGSGRSIPGFNLIEALGDTADLLVRFGGHAMAAGLALPAAAVPEFRRRFQEAAAARLRPEELIPTLRADAEAALADLGPDVVREMGRLGPFGVGNPAPVLVTRGLRAIGARAMGASGAHLRLAVTDGEAVREAVGFRLGERSEVLAFTNAAVDLAYTPALDVWQERERVQLIVHALETPGVDPEAVLTDAAALVERLFARADEYLAFGRGLEARETFYTKVAGVTYEDRQEVVRAVEPGETLRLVRDPRNPHDPHAIRVLAASGRQAGFLPARVAARIAPSIDVGARYVAIASSVTGGGPGRSFGLNLLVRRETPEAWHDGADRVRLALAELPARDRLPRVRIHLGATRLGRPHHDEIVEAIVSGAAAAAVVGYGRGAWAAARVACATVALDGPVVVAAPLASRAEEIFERWARALGRLGLRCARLHGALRDGEREATLSAVRHGEVDVLVASAAALARPDEAARGFAARARRIVIETPDLTPETVETAARIIEGAGGPPFVLAAEGTDAGLDLAARRLGASRVVADESVRTDIRLIDRRGTADPLDYLALHLQKPERTVVYVDDPREAVGLAAALRERLPHLRPAIAYLHPALPLRVRETLEHLLGDGKITVLVATGPLEDPRGVRHVVLARVPRTRTAWLEAAAQAGGDGRAASVHLLYNDRNARAAAARLLEAFPDRATLASAYRAIRRSGGLVWPDDRSPAAVDRDGPALSRRAMGAAIAILAEAGAVTRQSDEAGVRIEAIAGSPVDLFDSLRYAEGEAERAASRDALRWALEAPATELLRSLAGGRPVEGNARA